MGRVLRDGDGGRPIGAEWFDVLEVLPVGELLAGKGVELRDVEPYRIVLVGVEYVALESGRRGGVDIYALEQFCLLEGSAADVVDGGG